MEIKNKYKMTVEENIFYAKRNLVDSMWKAANLEGIAVTYPQTEMIFDELAVQNMYIKDINAIINLKHAWYFILENTSYPVDIPFISKVHQLVGEANVIPYPGIIRTTEVDMGGTEWKPSIPDKEKIKEDLEILLNSDKSETEKAIDMMLYICRSQPFYDGNKRVATLVANHILIQNGVGLLSIPIQKQLEFKNLLIKFYETNNNKNIKEFLYKECIKGIAFES